MKKYKLIKEYPGSPKLGNIITEFAIDSKQNYIEPEIYPEYWQEIKEKDYEILSFINKVSKSIGSKRKSEGFSFDENRESDSTHPKEHIYLNNPNIYSIHTVKRLSDGEIFTIGDFILEQNERSRIEYFEKRGNDMCIRINHQITGGYSTITMGYSEFTKYNSKPLFTTEDGVDVFEGSIVTCVANSYRLSDPFKVIKDYKPKTGYIYFANKEKAEEYILLNKPCLSFNNVVKLLPCYFTFSNSQLIKDYIKSKF